jgi:replicative DNA helicase
VERFYEKYGKQIKIYDEVFSMNGIEAFTKKSEKDIVMIDYVQAVEVKGDNEVQKMTEVARRIQKLAIETRKPIIDLSQVSNNGVDWKS